LFQTNLLKALLYTAPFFWINPDILCFSERGERKSLMSREKEELYSGLYEHIPLSAKIDDNAVLIRSLPLGSPLGLPFGKVYLNRLPAALPLSGCLRGNLLFSGFLRVVLMQ